MEKFNLVKLYGIAGFLLTSFFISHSWSETEIERFPVSIAALQEFGQVKSGALRSGRFPFKNLWVDHLGAFITQGAKINGNIDLAVGLGGIFQFPQPEGDPPGPGWPSVRTKFFFAGPTIAEIMYNVGDPENPWLRIGGGMFPYKYNGDAQNLGEYLFKSEAYPNLLYTGGYAVVGAPAAYLQGLKANFNFGNFKFDVLGLFETGIPPLYDLSLGIVGSYSVANGFLDLGFGVNFKRFFHLRNKASQGDDNPENAYFSYYTTEGTGAQVYYSGFTKTYSNEKSYYQQRVWDSVNVVASQASMDSLQSIINLVGRLHNIKNRIQDLDSLIPATVGDPVLQGQYSAELATYADSNPTYEYFSPQATMLMFRFTINPQALLQSELFGPNDLKIFFETTLLGLEDYPLFYTDKMERLPIMFGFNLPGFKFFDLISIQVEQHKSPYPNNAWNRGGSGGSTPVYAPYLPDGNYDFFHDTYYNDISDNDDFSWSVVVRKKLVAGLNLSVQVGRDHLRLVSDEFYWGPNLEAQELTPKADNWYWMVQFGMGI